VGQFRIDVSFVLLVLSFVSLCAAHLHHGPILKISDCRNVKRKSREVIRFKAIMMTYLALIGSLFCMLAGKLKK
jgi:hypothetical protein